MFFLGKTLRDPLGLVARCEATISEWFRAHPTVLAAWQRQQQAVQAFKSDPAQPPDFPTQPALLSYLESRLNQ